MKCDKCQNKAYCDEHVGIRRICKRNGYNGFVMYTNANRIRNMSDEELADLLTAVAKKSAEMLCKSIKIVEVDLSKCDFEILTKAHLAWLKEEVSE